MARPQKFRQISPNTPKFNYFYPQGVDKQHIDNIYITAEEFEALRLRHSQHYNQTQAAAKMSISQATFSRMITFVYEKLTQALLHGRAISLQSHLFSQRCPMAIPPRRRNRGKNKLKFSSNVSDKSPLTKFKGWGCGDCGFIWNDLAQIPTKPQLEGNPACPECASKKTYRLIKKLTP